MNPAKAKFRRRIGNFTYFTVLTLKPCGAPTAVSSLSKTGLAGCIIRAKVHSTEVLWQKEKREFTHALTKTNSNTKAKKKNKNNNNDNNNRHHNKTKTTTNNSKSTQNKLRNNNKHNKKKHLLDQVLLDVVVVGRFE